MKSKLAIYTERHLKRTRHMPVDKSRTIFQILISPVLTKRRIISQHVKGVWNNIGLWFHFWQPQNWVGGQNKKSQEITQNIISLKAEFVPIQSDVNLRAGFHRVGKYFLKSLWNLVRFFKQHLLPNLSLFTQTTSQLSASK